MRQLKVDIEDIELALGNSFWEMSYYLDLETGEVIFIDSGTHTELENLYAEADFDEGGTLDLSEALQESDLPAWQKQAILEADRVEAGYGVRYVSLPQSDSHEAYRDMEDFIDTLDSERSERLRDRLRRAIQGRGAFRRFKGVLEDHPREQARWFEFERRQRQQRIRDWLAQYDVEPIFELPVRPPQPPVRPHLLAGALTFVRAARQLALRHAGGQCCPASCASR